MSTRTQIFSGTATEYLAKNIAKSFGQELGAIDHQKFSDGEFQVLFEESLRGNDVFLIQSTFPSSDNFMELLWMIDAAKRASARKIVAVIPYFGWARQDRKDKPRVAIGAKLMATMLQAAGVSRVVTMDLHADQIQGFFEVPVDHLYASSLFLDYMQTLDLSNVVMAAPDTGGTKRANSYAKHLNLDLAICYKQRKKANVIDSMTVIGDVVGKDVILVDDICDTAGTLTKAADMMLDKGAKSVRAMITHPVLSGPAYERIENSGLTELIVTDSIPLKKQSDKIRVISVADIFSEVIRNIVNFESISSHFKIS